MVPVQAAYLFHQPFLQQVLAGPFADIRRDGKPILPLWRRGRRHYMFGTHLYCIDVNTRHH